MTVREYIQRLEYLAQQYGDETPVRTQEMERWESRTCMEDASGPEVGKDDVKCRPTIDLR
jgi:hypothetical protein